MLLNAARMPPTIVVTDPCLQFLLFTKSGVAWVGHHVNDHNSVQPDHLLKVDVSTIIAVDVVHR